MVNVPVECVHGFMCTVHCDCEICVLAFTVYNANSICTVNQVSSPIFRPVKVTSYILCQQSHCSKTLRSLPHPSMCMCCRFFSVSFHFIRWVGSVWLPSFCFTSTFLFCCLWNSFHHGTFCIKCTILSTDTNTHTPEYLSSCFFCRWAIFPVVIYIETKNKRATHLLFFMVGGRDHLQSMK